MSLAVEVSSNCQFAVYLKSQPEECFFVGLLTNDAAAMRQKTASLPKAVAQSHKKTLEVLRRVKAHNGLN